MNLSQIHSSKMMFSKISDYNLFFLEAVEAGETETVKSLLSFNPAVDDNYVIMYASANGLTEMVRLLLQDPRVDPTADDNHAIREAAEGGHLEVVKLLLQDPRVDPTADNNYALRHATSYGYTEIIKLLEEKIR